LRSSLDSNGKATGKSVEAVAAMVAGIAKGVRTARPAPA